MAVDMFIKIGDIKGESQDSKHKGEIDVLAWSWGITQSGNMHAGGGGGSGKANVQDLSFTKYVDTASAGLMRACAIGDHIPKATLVVRKAGGKSPVEYIKIELDGLIVSSISTGGSGGEDRLTENVTLNFSKINYQYLSQKLDGSPDATFPFSFDIKQSVSA
jgi:type VI secretion system secreted protein Hcp